MAGVAMTPAMAEIVNAMNQRQRAKYYRYVELHGSAIVSVLHTAKGIRVVDVTAPTAPKRPANR